MSSDRKDRAFLSYASEDLEIVEKVYNGLVTRGLDVWFDKEDIGPGKWKPQITKAITKSRYFVICLSNAAIQKTGDEPGFQDEELSEAYEIAKNQPEKEFTIIPVRIENCDRGDHRLTSFQQYDLFADFEKGLDRLAVDMGGNSLSDVTAKDERSDDEKLIDGLLAKATTDFYAGKFNDSITFIESIINLSPENADAWLIKGSAYYYLDEHGKAMDAYDKALEIKPDFTRALIGKGIILRYFELPEYALKVFEKALKYSPENPDVWIGKGVVFHGVRKYEKALNSYNEALRLDPESTIAWYNKGISLWALNRMEEAIVAIKKALKTNPKNVAILHTLADAHRSIGQNDEANACYHRVLAVTSDKEAQTSASHNHNFWYYRGRALQDLGRYEEAIDEYDKVTKINPTKTDAFKRMFDLLRQLKDKD